MKIHNLFKTNIKNIINIHKDIYQLSKLKKGWYDISDKDEGYVFDNPSLAWLYVFSNIICAFHHNKMRMHPTPEGFVRFDWEKENISYFVEINTRNKFSYFFVSRDDLYSEFYFDFARGYEVINFIKMLNEII
jgi:hypothetical protein